MPKRRYESHEPTHEWQQIRLLRHPTRPRLPMRLFAPLFFGVRRQRSGEKKQACQPERFTTVNRLKFLKSPQIFKEADVWPCSSRSLARESASCRLTAREVASREPRRGHV